MLLVSIIVPIYGVEKHIERCLHSIIRQDYNGPIECILVDDCTPDNSVDIAKKILSNYNGNILFRWIRHDTNKGLSGARNSGTKLAKGDYIFYLDSDDEIITHAISSLVNLATKYSNVDIVYGDWYVSRKYNSLQNKLGLPEFIHNPRLIKYHLLKYDVSMTAPNKLIRRNYFIENNLSFLEGVLHEDEHMNYLFANTAKSIAISYIPTYIYFLNPNGITGSYGERNIKGIFSVVRNLLNLDFNDHVGMNIVHCLNLYIDPYLHSDKYKMNIEASTILRDLALYSYCKRQFLLYFYIRFLTLMPFKLFKKIRYSFVFRKINGLVYKLYFRKR